MAAYATTRQEASRRLGRVRRSGADTRLRRYLSKQLRAAREQWSEDQEELRRIGILQQVFLDHLAPNVVAELEEARRMQLGGASLIRRLEALRDRHRLNPPDADEGTSPSADAEIVRIICSDGLVGP